MTVRVGDRPGDVGEVIALHARLYAGEYDLDATFEGYVAFLVDAATRGRGLGRELLDRALAFARESGHELAETWVTTMWGRELARERYELAL